MAPQSRGSHFWLPAAAATLAVALNGQSLGGSFVWDDRAAVLGNRDISPATPWRDLFHHDFWGQDITESGSHKSYRPLAVASFRLDRILWRLGTSDDSTSGVGASLLSGLDPLAAAPAMHAINVILHAAACALAVPLFRAALGGREAPAALAAALFVAHPVHIEPVAALVGRADLLCGVFAMMALVVAGAAPPGNGNGGGGNGGGGGDSSGASGGPACSWPRFGLALLLGGAACLSKEVGVAVFGLLAAAEALHVINSWRPLAAAGASGPAGGDVTARNSVNNGQAAAAAHSRRYVAQKEVPDIVGDGRPKKAPAAAAAPYATAGPPVSTRPAVAAAVGTTAAASSAKKQKNGDDVRRRCVRFMLCTLCASAVVVARLRLHHGAGMRAWGVLENDIVTLLDRRARIMSYAHTHVRYAGLLLWPSQLCYDWGFSCIPQIETVADPRNLASLALYAALAALAVAGLWGRDMTLLWGLALLVVPFLPAAQIFFPVGTVLAERLLYLPSLGACVLATHAAFGRPVPKAKPPWRGASRQAWRRLGNAAVAGDIAGGTAAASSGNSSKHLVSVAAAPAANGANGKEKTVAAAAGAMHGAHANETHTPHAAAGKLSQAPRSFSSLASASVAAATPATNNAVASITKIGSFARRGLRWLLPLWAVGFAARGIRRGRDWATERTLFEAALETCPDGIKTLNNLAMLLLADDATAPAVAATATATMLGSNAGVSKPWLDRAAILLDRALELHPTYPAALLNRALVSRRVDDLAGCVRHMLAALRLPPSPDDGKVYLYLGESLLRIHEGEADLPADAVVDLDLLEVMRRAGGGGGGGGGSVAGLNEETMATATATAAAVLKAGATARPKSKVTAEATAPGTLAPTAAAVSPARDLLGQAEIALKRAEAALGPTALVLPLLPHCRGRAAALGGRHAEAARHFEVALAANARAPPAERVSDAATCNLAALAVRDAAGAAAALPVFDAALRRHPADLALLVNAALARHDAGDAAGAVWLCGEALRQHPGSPEAATNLGWLRESGGDLAAAHELYRRAVGMTGPARALPQLLVNLQNIRIRLGLPPDADDGDG